MAVSIQHARGQRALAHEKAALPVAPRDRHQLVAGHAAPRGEIFLDRDFGRGELEQLAVRQRIDVLADQQEQAVAAVEIAAVEARVGLERMALGVRHRLLLSSQ
jgi:hypothetical protein